MADLEIGVVDVHVLRFERGNFRVLNLKRSNFSRSPGSWECVHGHIDDGERPEDAALREVKEETGLAASRLYNVCVLPFYLHRSATVQMAIVFAALVESEGVTLGPEHDAFLWLSAADSLRQFSWPRDAQSLQAAVALLRGGDAGSVEDVLRVC